MYYKVLIIWLISSSFACKGNDHELNAIVFNNVCMKAWTHTDVIKAITISPEGKAEVLEKILCLLVKAYGLFNELYAAKAETSKAYGQDTYIISTHETLALIRDSIGETFEGCASKIAYETSLNLLNLMLKKLEALEH